MPKKKPALKAAAKQVVAKKAATNHRFDTAKVAYYHKVVAAEKKTR